MNEYQGGFSDGVFKSDAFQKYVNSDGVFGYIGASRRSDRKDKIVETILRSRGLENEGVATWLTSGDGRHLMDDIPKQISQFTQRVDDYTIHAFVNVLIWGHPDHTGFLSSTRKLQKLAKKSLEGVVNFKKERKKTRSGKLELAKAYLKKKGLHFYSDKNKSSYSLKLWSGKRNNKLANLADSVKIIKRVAYGPYDRPINTRYIFEL